MTILQQFADYKLQFIIMAAPTSICSVLLCFASLSLCLGWSTQTSSTGNNLYGVSFVNPTHGWAVGASGTVLATTNGGNAWSAQTSGTSNKLRGVSCVSETHGWAVGDGGTVLATTNGGNAWSAQTSGTSNNLYEVSWVSETHGWAVGASGTVIATTNGGNTWSAQNSGQNGAFTGARILSGVQFVNRTHGWVVGPSGWGPAALIATTDGGNSWNAQRGGNYIGISFVNPTHGWAVGSLGTSLIRTTQMEEIHGQ